MAKKIGRNDPCHCGSELKYKKCHGDFIKIETAKQAYLDKFDGLIEIEKLKGKKDESNRQSRGVPRVCDKSRGG